jgi:hypothetical protein
VSQVSDATDTSRASAPPVSLETVYAEVRGAIKETDGISFKLLGLVPLFSGSALLGLILESAPLPDALITVLGLFAAAVTLGIFRWELRNVQTCSWLIRYADALEEHALRSRGLSGVVQSRPKPPQGVGKSEAQKLIYTTTILAWLALPPALGAVSGQTRGSVIYYAVAAAVALATGLSVVADPRVPRFPALPPTSPPFRDQPSD